MYLIWLVDWAGELLGARVGPGSRFEPKDKDNLPVTMVTWEKTAKFCEKLSELPAPVPPWLP